MARAKILQILFRRKPIDDGILETELQRCLRLWQLTAIGIGATLGATAYVLIGMVAMETAGPAIVLSFLIAASSSMLAGLCYAELGSRMPRAGSVYEYAYATLGEGFAFIVGWNVILENLCGAAYVARSLSGYMDSLSEGAMSAWYLKVAPIPGNIFSAYFDLMAFFLVIMMGTMIGSGVRFSTTVQGLLTIVNFSVILFIIFAGSIKANPANWFLPEAEIPEGHGVGGFFPYGITGVMRGAAICFFGFVGFESLTYAGEEVHNPRRNLPFAILITILTICTLYCAVCIVQTMMLPYYLLDAKAALVQTFIAVGWGWARYMVMPGAVCGMCGSMFGAMMPLPRLLMSMAHDGLLFHCLSSVNRVTKTPLCATIVSTIMMALLAGFLDTSQLIFMLCVGTLLSYNSVAVCVMIQRYKPIVPDDSKVSWRTMMQTFRAKTSSKSSLICVISGLILYMLTCILCGVLWVYVEGTIIYVIILHVIILIILIVLYLQPRHKWSAEQKLFNTPLVPLIPLVSIYINIHLMILLEPEVYMRTASWFAIGIPIYILCLFIYKRCSVDPGMIDNGSTEPPLKISDRNDSTRASKRSRSLRQEKRLSRMGDLHEQTEQNAFQFGRINEVIILQQAIVESNEEKEAKIIEFLDQVLQAEEDSYDDTVSLREQSIESVSVNETHRKSLGELSDAGSDASVSNQVLSKYDVVAQVHREDLPKVSEEDERNENEDMSVSENNIETNEIKENSVNISNTVFDDSETNSHTDESGYSDTMKSTINESTEDTTYENAPYIPTPPPLDESFFAKPVFHKSYSFTLRPPPKVAPIEIEEENKPRVSLQSNGSLDDGHIVFGSDKQMNFMTKLNTIFQSKMVNDSDTEQRQRSHSTGNVINDTELKRFDHPPILADLNKEFLLKEASYNLKPVLSENSKIEAEALDTEEPSMSRDEMKSKLESIFASGGPQLIKPRLIKSIPSAPENSQTHESSTEIVIKAPKIEKNDTLKRQKDRFSAVLNSFMLNLNKESEF